jgi:hypothetical protein
LLHRPILHHVPPRHDAAEVVYRPERVPYLGVGPWQRSLAWC